MRTPRPHEFELKATYPEPRRSRRLAWGNLLFPFHNPCFGIVPAILYLMTAWLVGSTVGDAVPSSVLEAVELTRRVPRAPRLAAVGSGGAAVLLAFTDTHSRIYRVARRTGALRRAPDAIFYIGWGTATSPRAGSDRRPLQSGLGGIVVFVAGWVVGSVVVGIYLLISVNVFGRHSEEAFSACGSQDYKHFLRLHVGPTAR